MSAASSREAWLRLEYEAVAKAAVSDRSISGVYVVPSPEGVQAPLLVEPVLPYDVC